MIFLTTNPPEKRFVHQYFLLSNIEWRRRRGWQEDWHWTASCWTFEQCDDGTDAIRRRQYKMYSSRSWFKHSAPVVDSMPQNYLQDPIQLLLHFVDNWEIEDDDNEQNTWNAMFNYFCYNNNNDNNSRQVSCCRMISLSMYNWTWCNTNSNRCYTIFYCCNMQ